MSFKEYKEQLKAGKSTVDPRIEQKKQLQIAVDDLKKSWPRAFFVLNRYKDKLKETGTLTPEEYEYAEDIANDVESILAQRMNLTLEDYRKKVTVYSYAYNRPNQFVFDDTKPLFPIKKDKEDVE